MKNDPPVKSAAGAADALMAIFGYRRVKERKVKREKPQQPEDNSATEV